MKTNTFAFFKRFKKQIKGDLQIKSVFTDKGELFFKIEHSPFDKEKNVIFELSYPYFDDLDLFISSFDEIRHRKRLALGNKLPTGLTQYTLWAEICLHDLINKFQEIIDKQGVKDEQ